VTKFISVKCNVEKLLKIVDGTANHILVYVFSFGTNFIVENYKI